MRGYPSVFLFISLHALVVHQSPPWGLGPVTSYRIFKVILLEWDGNRLGFIHPAMRILKKEHTAIAMYTRVPVRCLQPRVIAINISESVIFNCTHDTHGRHTFPSGACAQSPTAEEEIETEEERRIEVSHLQGLRNAKKFLWFTST